MFGPGWRANATIGRALRLVCVNLGGAAPGEVSMSTLAHPGRYTYCIGEREEASPWAVARRSSTASRRPTTRSPLLAADAPLDRRTTSGAAPPRICCRPSPLSLAVLEHHKMTHWGDTLLVLSPGHASVLGAEGWSKADVQRFLFDRLQKPVSALVPRHRRRRGPARPRAAQVRRSREHDPTLIPKFRAPEHLKIVVAGGSAGRISAVVAGWSLLEGLVTS